MRWEFDTILHDFRSKLWHVHIKLPFEISEAILDQKLKRLKCTLNGKVTFPCGLMPEGEGQYFINVNKAVRKAIQADTGDKVSVELVPDDSQYGLPMPEELGYLLGEDPEADRIFHELTPGKQRNLLYIAGQNKSSDVRLRKSLAIIDHLKMTKGKLDFKVLNQAMRPK